MLHQTPAFLAGYFEKNAVWRRAILLILLGWGSSVFATDYHVSPSGSDVNSGTLAQPWKTLAKAVQTVRAGDTVYLHGGVYNEDLNPITSGRADAPIRFVRYQNETPTIKGYGQGGTEAVVALGYPGSLKDWTSVSYITLDGLRIEPTDASYGIALYSKNNTGIVIQNCELVCTNRTSPRNHGILVGAAQHTLVENNYIHGDWDLGIITTASPKYTIVRNNRIESPVGSCIDIQTSQGANQAMLVEGNTLTGSRTEDGIQFEPDYNLSFDEGTFRGVIIRNNVIANHAENGIDLKGSAHVVIEGNLIYNCRGDNDGSGNSGGGTGGIMKGDATHTQAHNILIRNNRIYDNLGGISIHNHGWVVVHNTLVNNNRSFLGTHTSASQIETVSSGYQGRLPGLVGVILTDSRPTSFRNTEIKNNLMGGHHQGEIAVRPGSHLAQGEVDGNLYFNADGVQTASVVSTWNWSKISHAALKQQLQAISGLRGQEAHSQVVSDPGLGLSDDRPTGSNLDFSLKSGSPAIDAALPLTRTTTAGSGRVISVVNARCFSSGYDIVPGDTLVIASSGATAQILAIDTDNQTLTVDHSLSWQANDGLTRPYEGSGPDIGALESKAAAADPVTPLSGGFSIQPARGTVPFTVSPQLQFQGGKAPHSVRWNYGDGTIATGDPSQHTYTQAGTYTLSVEVTDGAGQKLTDSETLDLVEPINAQIKSSMGKAMVVPMAVTLTSTVSGGKTPYVFRWTLDGVAVGFSEVLSLQLESGGEKQVILQATDQWGQVAKDTLILELVEPLTLQANGSLSSPTAPTIWRLNAQMQGGKAPYSVQWRWGGSTQSTAWQVNRNLGSQGQYQAICEVSDVSGQTAKDTLDVTLSDALSLVASASPAVGVAPFWVDFTSQSAGGVAPVTINWQLGNGIPIQGAQYRHQFTMPGVYAMQCTARDGQGREQSQSVQVEVLAPLSAMITASQTTGPAPLIIQLQAAGQGGKAPYDYAWTWGDGQSGETGASPQHQFTDPGTYRVQLSVRDGFNATASATLDIVVTEPQSLASVQQVLFVQSDNQQPASRLVADRWTDVIIHASGANSWKDIAFVDFWISGEGETDGTVENRGGTFSARSNYVMSLSVADGTLWVKQDEGQENWTEITGQTGSYVDARPSASQFDPSSGILKAKMKLASNVNPGNWKVTAVAYDAQRIHSEPVQSSIWVQSTQETPTAQIQVTGPNQDNLTVQLTASSQLKEIPSSLSFVDQKGQTQEIVLTGSVPGNRFTGSLKVNDKLAEGLGQFILENWALVDINGNVGDRITQGADLVIDKTPPTKPNRVSIKE